MADRAVELSEGNIDKIYYLPKEGWKEVSLGREVPYSECKKWEAATLELTKKRLANMPDGDLKRLTLRMIEPQLSVSMENGMLVMANEFIRYRIEPSDALSKDQAEALYEYDHMGAYRKAMVDRTVGLFAQLAVTSEMKSRKIVPATIEVKLEMKDKTMETTVEYKYSAISKKKMKLLEGALED